jgi:hypothetical protein
MLSLLLLSDSYHKSPLPPFLFLIPKSSPLHPFGSTLLPISFLSFTLYCIIVLFFTCSVLCLYIALPFIYLRLLLAISVTLPAFLYSVILPSPCIPHYTCKYLSRIQPLSPMSFTNPSFFPQTLILKRSHLHYASPPFLSPYYYEYLRSFPFPILLPICPLSCTPFSFYYYSLFSASCFSLLMLSSRPISHPLSHSLPFLLPTSPICFSLSTPLS